MKQPLLKSDAALAARIFGITIEQARAMMSDTSDLWRKWADQAEARGNCHAEAEYRAIASDYWQASQVVYSSTHWKACTPDGANYYFTTEQKAHNFAGNTGGTFHGPAPLEEIKNILEKINAYNK